MTTETDTAKPDIGDDPITQPVPRATPTYSDLSALYSENGSIARAIMEWRHKVITLYVLTVGAVGSAVLWLQKNDALQNIPLLFFLTAIVLCVLGLMDHTNARILGACYRVGDSIERALGTDGAIYAALHARRQSRRTITYTRIMYGLNFGSAAISLWMALYFTWRPLS